MRFAFVAYPASSRNLHHVAAGATPSGLVNHQSTSNVLFRDTSF